MYDKCGKMEMMGLPALDLIIDSVIGGETAIIDQVHSSSLYQ